MKNEKRGKYFGVFSLRHGPLAEEHEKTEHGNRGPGSGHVDRYREKDIRHFENA